MGEEKIVGHQKSIRDGDYLRGIVCGKVKGQVARGEGAGTVWLWWLEFRCHATYAYT